MSYCYCLEKTEKPGTKQTICPGPRAPMNTDIRFDDVNNYILQAEKKNQNAELAKRTLV